MYAIVLALIASPLLLHDTDVLFDTQMVARTQSVAFVSVRGARSLTESEPVLGASVVLSIADREVARASTDAEGNAPLLFQVPALDPGSYSLTIETRSEHGSDRIQRTVKVVRSLVLSLRTDRSVYRPGETIRFGVALLNRPDAHPLGGTKVTVAVKEPMGTEIWRGAIDVGETGFGEGKLALGDDLRLGAYHVEATAFSETVSREVTVREVELPAFFVRVDDAGQAVARYPYGEPVQGDVEIRADGHTLEKGHLDAFGRYSIPLAPRTHAQLEVAVTDGAERTESASWSPPRPGDGVSVAIVPERRELSGGRTQFVTIVTTDGRGHLAPATVDLGGTGVEVHGAARRESLGAVRYAITPSSPATLHVVATAANGRTAHSEERLRVGRGGPWLRPVRAVWSAGEAMEIFGRFARAHGPVVLTLVRGRIPLATAIALPDARGYFTASLSAPEGVFGLATVRAAEVGWNPADARDRPIDRRTNASVYLIPAPLDVAIDGRARFRPGETAELTASVKDRAGRPAANVGLFASVVDERSLSLGERQKDLASLLRSLDVERAPLLGVAFTDLLPHDQVEARLAARAIVESLPPEDLDPSIEIEAAQRRQSERGRMPAVREAAIGVLVDVEGAIGVETPAGWRFKRSLAALLAEAGWKGEQVETPWKRPLSWGYVHPLDRTLSFASIARQVADRRLDALAIALQANRALAAKSGILGMIASGHLGKNLATDPWGGGVRLSVSGGGSVRSAGADGRFETGDDLVRTGVFESGGIGGLGTYGYGSGGGAMFGAVGRARAGTVRVTAAIRSRFDETVLWAAGLHTDANGRAILRVPFSDSVTGWQLDVDALGPTGAVGHGMKRLETFLPLSVDAAVPHRLTTGDRYTLSAVAANHTEEELTLAVTLEASGTVELIGESQRAVRLPPGTTAAARFELRAASAGTGSVLLALSRQDGSVVDRVKRQIEVDGPGRLVQVALTKQLAFTVPANVESFQGRLRLFRSPVDQALDGVEDLLSEPHGCFEQTSSSTYPNLMVLRLLKETEKNVAIRERAYDLVATGYQRLIAYEVRGGGFSWFGETPANQALTAYGLLEFADMAKVYPVDAKMVDRTRAWLLAKQRKDGSWAPDASWLHDWSAVQGEVAITTYVTWALVESDYRGPEIDRALAFLAAHETEIAKRPYLLALWAAAARSPSLLAKLRSHQRKEEGGLAFGAGDETLFYVKGQAADVQVTALAVPLLRETLAFQDAGEALKWIWSARTPRYGWGSPQGTVLALRAAVESPAQSSDEGAAAVTMDGRAIGAVDLSSVGVPTLDLPVVAAGAHAISIASAPVLADLRLSWRSLDASTPVHQGLSVELSVPADPVRFGATAPVRLTVENTTDQDVPMPTAIVPIPPGFAPDKRSLAALVSAGRIDHFEATGAAVQLYLSKLTKHETIELRYALIAGAECDVTQRAAQVYAYYDPETRGESTNLRVRAVP